jgi:hypothetical protein
MENKQTLTFAHAALMDYLQFLRDWRGNRLDDVRSRIDIDREIADLNSTINDLEKAFPYLDIDNQNLN